MISTSIRATWSRTCTSLLALGALTASSAMADVARPDVRSSRLSVDRTIGRLDMTAVTQSYQIRVLNADGSVASISGLTNADGVFLAKTRPALDGSFSVTGTPGDKLGVATDASALSGQPLVGFALPDSSAGVVDVYLPGDVLGTHSAGSQTSGGFSGLDRTGLGNRDLGLDVGGTTCDGAVLLGVPGTDAGNTTGNAIIPAGTPNCGVGSGMGSPAAWYTIIGNGNVITVETCGPATTLDTVLHVWRQCGTPCGATTLFCMGANDDTCAYGGGGSFFASRVTFASALGETYKVAVSGFGTGSGAYTINTFNGAPSVNPIICPPPPEPTGACCVTNAPPFEQDEAAVACSIETADDCTALGGTWQGEDVPCYTGDITFAEHESFPNLAIPDANATGVTSTLNVAAAGIVQDVNVEIDITHTWIGDLRLDVISPEGTSVRLWTQNCGSTDNFHGTADDEGVSAFVVLCTTINANGFNGNDADGFQSDGFADMANTLSKRYQRDGGVGTPLTLVDGENAQGDWTFAAADLVGADIGSIQHWGLELLTLSNLIGACGSFDCPPGGPCDSCCPPDEPCDDDGRVELCHIPPGNTFNAHTIAVGPSAVQHHLDHGDTLGECP